MIHDVHSPATPASASLRELACDEPGRTALEIDDRRISYGELNEQADRLAHQLVSRSQPGERIALRTNGTHELAVGMLAIQRSGAVSVPVDPTAPPERVQAIINEVEPAVMLSDIAGDRELALPVAVEHPLALAASSATSTPIDIPGDEMSSIIYTSGSTGTPKGIMVSRVQGSALANSLTALDRCANSRFGALAAGTVTHAEHLVTFLLHHRLTLVCYEIRRRGLVGLAEWIARSEITGIYTVPTVMRHLLSTVAPDRRFPHLRAVLLSGETVTGEDVLRLRPHLAPTAIVVSAFGLTEAPGIASLVIPSDMAVTPGALPVGRLSPDFEVEIQDPEGRPVPAGARGEIVVRSAVMALGYWRRPDLTEASFRDLGDGRREFRTGDAGRLREDGLLAHLGRLDHLIKVAGNRVELGEVEQELSRLGPVAAAAAAPFDDGQGGTRLAACVVPVPGHDIDLRVIRTELARRLPGYMVPTRIAVAAALPQLPSGKVDRKRVAELPVLQTGSSEATHSDLEAALAGIWRRILGAERIGRHDDFFAIGGDSLDAARMFLALEAELGLDRPVSLLAEAPTIASLATLLQSDADAWDAPLAVRTEGTQPPLFVIHDGIGSVLYARGLAHALGPDQPIYGIRCEGLSGRGPSQRSLTDLAGAYADKIQTLYRHGPYRFYGVSLGGVIAMEVARHLLERGEQVPLVVLGDSVAPEPRLRARSGSELTYHLAILRRTPPGERAAYASSVARSKLVWLVGREGRQMREEDRRLTDVLQRGEQVPTDLRGRYVVREYGRLAATHRPRPPFPEVTLLLRVGRPGPSADLGWRALLGDSLKIVDVPGSHNDLGREASGVYVGPVIARSLPGLATVAA